MEAFIRFLHVLTFLLLTSLLHPTSVVSSLLGNETDHLALLKFKDSIVADPHGFLNSWNDSILFCNWYGVTCGRRHQRVTAMNLSDADLRGTISPFIGNLSFLRAFILFNNSFSGYIPQQVGHLSRLRHLNLTNNMLEGGIPVNLSFCSELSIIGIAGNRLTGKIPPEIGTLMKLELVTFEKNKLTGGIPPSLGNLSSITVLSMADNNLVGTFPEEIGRLQKLYRFHISINQLSGTIPPSIFNLSSMKSFSVADNAFKGTIPPGVGLNMPHLLEIGLGLNEFSGPILASLLNASKLQIVDIWRNNFVGPVPTSFGYHLQDLRLLDLYHNNHGSGKSKDFEFISSMTNCSHLNELNIGANNFGGVLPKSIGNLSTQITELYMAGNPTSGRIPETLANLKNLIILCIDGTLFTGVIPTSFGTFQKLQVLQLRGNRLSGDIPSSLGNLTRLYYVDLSANQFAGTIPPSTGNCHFLKQMYVSENHLSGDIPLQLFVLSSLIYLNLSHNSLTGNFPMKVGKLKTISTLDISGNNLTGDIPYAIRECLSLEFLYLQGNLFQGMIPSSLASLRGLQYLDLSGNNLSNQIPTDLQRLPFLIYLNLSSNNLEGEVPREGVFRNTSAVSLDGNIKLCGGVSELQLPACPIKEPKQTQLRGFKLYLIVSLVVGCSLLFVSIFTLYWRRKTQSKKPLSTELSVNFLSKISYQTLHQATGGFSPCNHLGSGGFGSVYKGILDQEESNIVAIKVLNLQLKGASKSFVVECNAMRNIRHRNLVKILTCCSSTNHNGNEFKALVYEYMSNESLEKWLHRENQSRCLNILQRLNIAVDVASALCYLHDGCEPQIIHRDMKPSNILLDDDMVAHVGDFGLARLISPTTDSSENQSSTVGIKGTIGYTAPEYAVGNEPSKQGDVYSYGILVLELFTGRRPTDEMFGDGCDIHTSVKMAIPAGRVMQIIDNTLLATLEETTPATTQNEVNYLGGYNNDIKADEENIGSEVSSKMKAYVWRCILPTLKIGLACSQESPRNRMSMKDALMELHHIKNAYTSVNMRRDRPRRS